MTYEQPRQEIEPSVIGLAVAYATFLISLIVWVA